MTDSERAFLRASQQAYVVAKQRRRFRRTISSLSGIAITIGLIAITALYFLSRSAEQVAQLKNLTQQFHSSQLAVQARTFLDSQPDLALLLSLEAYQVYDSVETRSSLLSALESRLQVSAFLRSHTDGVTGVSFSPDGKLLASSSADDTIILWDVVAHQRLDPPLAGHTDGVWSIAFSPDGKTLASGSADDTIILWDVAARKLFNPPISGHTGAVGSITFAAAGTLLASVSTNRTLILWDASVESWKARACRIANRNLTQDEWNRFIGPDTSYRRTCDSLPPGAGR